MSNVTAAAIARARRAIATGGGYLISCPCPSHGKGRGDLKPSLFIRDGESRLLVRCFAGCEPADVLRAFGLDHPATVSPAAPAVRLSGPAGPQTTTTAARRIWRTARPIAGTHAADYLVARGLGPPFPSSVRFLPQSERNPYPTLVAAITDPDAWVVAVELTYLDPRMPRKADLPTQRRVIGPALGAAIHCARAGETLGLAEGFESALSAQRLFSIPTWAAAARRLPAIVLPPVVRRLVYFGDPDKAGSWALTSLRDAQSGIEIIDCTSPYPDRDWNELLQAGFVPDRELAGIAPRGKP